MPTFEVFLPAAPPALPGDVTLRVEAENWLAALKAGLQKMGAGTMATNILCDIKDDNSIHVTDPNAGRVFRIKEFDPSVEATQPQKVVPSEIAARAEPPPRPAAPDPSSERTQPNAPNPMLARPAPAPPQARK